MEKENMPAPAISGIILPIRGDLLVFHRIGIAALTPAARRAAVRLAQVWPELPGPPNPPGVHGGVIRRESGFLDVALPLQDLTPPDAAGAANAAGSGAAAAPRTIRQLAGDLLLAEVVRHEGGAWITPPTFPTWVEFHYGRADLRTIAARGLPFLPATPGLDDAEAAAMADRFPTSVWQTLVAHWGVVMSDEDVRAAAPHVVLGKLGATAAIMRLPVVDFRAVAALATWLALYGLALGAARDAA